MLRPAHRPLRVGLELAAPATASAPRLALHWEGTCSNTVGESGSSNHCAAQRADGTVLGYWEGEYFDGGRWDGELSWKMSKAYGTCRDYETTCTVEGGGSGTRRFRAEDRCAGTGYDGTCAYRAYR